MKNRFILFIASVFLMTFSLSLFAQVKTPAELRTIYRNGNDISNSEVISKQEHEILTGNNIISPQEEQLERQLDIARLNGNTMLAHSLQSQLDNLKGHVQVYQPNLQNDYYPGAPIEGNGSDYNVASIHSFSIYSHAFGIAPTGSTIAGRLFYLFSQDSQTGGDTLKLMNSTNNGATWQPNIWISFTGYTFNKDEMDIEVVYDGTNTWVFGVIGVTDQADNRKKVYFFRQNVSGSGYYATFLNFPGSGAGMNYYNPRITSDNANYTAIAYLMVVCSMDSVFSGSSHKLKQKYMVSSAPFGASPSINYSQPSGAAGFCWQDTYSGYLQSDIAYFKDDGGTGLGKVMTTYCYGNDIISVAYLNGYNNFGDSYSLSIDKPAKDVRIAFNGGANNRYGMITSMSMYNPTDWDIVSIKTSNGGNGWILGNVDFTSERSRTNDLIAVRNASNQFKCFYAQDHAGNTAGYFTEWNGSAWSTPLQATNAPVDTTYGEPRAGYLLGGGDNGLGIWSLYNGYNGYASKLINGTVGIINNEIPSGFSLSQNYPNPFNPTTNIKFALPVAGKVSLKIFDVTGKQVADVINQNLEAGTHEINFNASNLSSGVYFYRLDVSSEGSSKTGFTGIKKMILVK